MEAQGTVPSGEGGGPRLQPHALLPSLPRAAPLPALAARQQGASHRFMEGACVLQGPYAGAPKTPYEK